MAHVRLSRMDLLRRGRMGSLEVMWVRKWNRIGHLESTMEVY